MHNYASKDITITTSVIRVQLEKHSTDIKEGKIHIVTYSVLHSEMEPICSIC